MQMQIVYRDYHLIQVINHITEIDDATMINKLQTEAALGVDHIQNATRSDPTLSRVLEYTLSGWPETIDSKTIRPYCHKSHEITTEDGCLLWRIRVIIPTVLRDQVLNELHVGHPDIVRMKSIRCYKQPKFASD